MAPTKVNAKKLYKNLVRFGKAVRTGRYRPDTRNRYMNQKGRPVLERVALKVRH